MLAKPKRSDLKRYGVAILVVVATVLLKATLSPLIEPDTWPFMLALLPVLISAWIGGWGPGLVATVLMALLVDYFWLGPPQSLRIDDPDTALRAALFLIEGSVLSWIVDQLHVARQRGDVSSEKFELLAEGATDAAIILMDAQGRITGWNSGSERLFGYHSAEIEGQLFDRLYAGQDLQGGRPQQDLAVAAEHGEWRGEGWRVRKDGSRFWADVTIRRLPGPPGSMRGFSQVARDLSERKRTEARLGAEYAVTRILADAQSLPEAGPAIVQAIRQSIDADIGALWLPEASGESLHCSVIDEVETSDAFASFTTASRAMHFAPGIGLPGRVWQTRTAACVVDVQSDPNFPRAPFAAAAGLRSGVGFPIIAGTEFIGVMEFLTRWKLEPDEALLRMMEAIGSEMGQFVQRRRAERQVEVLNQNLRERVLELQQSEDQFRASFQLAAVGKALIEPVTGRLLRVNNRLCTILRSDGAQLTRRSLFDLVHGDDAKSIATDVQQLVDGQLPEFSNEIRFVAGNGELLWASITATLVRDAGGQPKQLIAVIQDVTARKLIEQELERYRTRLEELVGERTTALQETHQRLRVSERMAALGTLSAGLGHDMGNLLLPVRLRLEAMEIKGMPADLREDVEAIGKCADYLQRLANGLRLLSLDPENAAASTERTELKEWWLDVESFLKNALPRGVELERRFADDLPPVAVPRHRLTQAIFNLVQNAGNAIKVGGPGRVCVWAEPGRRQGTLTLGVTDNGSGMTEEVKARCLEPFFTSKTRGISTGLGLALVLGIVQKAGGTIDIDSTPGKGTTFTLTLPAAQRAAPPAPPRASIRRPLRAAVDIADTRLRTYVSSVLRMLQVEVVAKQEFSNNSVDLRVIDGASGPVSGPAISGPPGQSGKAAAHGPAIGKTPDSRRHPQTVVLDEHAKPAAIRKALRQVVDEISIEQEPNVDARAASVSGRDSRPVRG